MKTNIRIKRSYTRLKARNNKLKINFDIFLRACTWVNLLEHELQRIGYTREQIEAIKNTSNHC